VTSKPTEQVRPEHDESDQAEETPEQVLTPGAVLDHGRYRLLAHVGSDTRCDAQLWRAKDGVLGRDVALTILVGDRGNADAAAGARRTLERAMHASTFNHVGVARVLDVVTPSPGDPAGVLGAVIAEWTHGTDLLDLVSQGPLPPGTAARLLQPLAAAVEAAHHAGLVLGSDHPQRIRVTTDGEIRMAFPGPQPKATSSEDVRGLGAALYLLLTGRWALSGGREGLPAAPAGPDGTVIAPRTLRPTVPLELSTVAVRALGGPDTASNSGVRTGAAILRVLEQHATFESPTAVMEAVQASSAAAENDVWRTEDAAVDQGKRKKLMISVGVLAVATLLVVGWIIAVVIGMFTGNDSNSGPSKVLGPDGKPLSSQSSPQQSSAPAPVAIVGASAFSPQDTPDSPDKVNSLFDGNPATSWNTASYFQQFGPRGLKEGTGVVLNLAASTVVRTVTIDSPSAGTHIEIRSAASDHPDLASSPVIGAADVSGPQTTIPINASQPNQHLIVWITQLSPKDGQFASQLNEATVTGSPS
jgi:hypothetical protein